MGKLEPAGTIFHTMLRMVSTSPSRHRAKRGIQGIQLEVPVAPTRYALLAPHASPLADFADSIGDLTHAYFIGYPYWIDGRAIARYSRSFCGE